MEPYGETKQVAVGENRSGPHGELGFSELPESRLRRIFTGFGPRI